MLVPDGDLFAAMRAGKASIVNGEIETFTETGLRLTSGQELAADVIVTATGLKVRLMGGVAIEVDGAPVDIAAAITYKSVMFSDIPNLASIFGYTNASWTLKSDLIADYVCRLLSHMDRRGYAICTPRLRGAAIADGPTLPLTSGYIERAKDLLFKQGTKKALAHESELRARRHGLALRRDRGRRARVQAARSWKPRGVTALCGLVRSAMIIKTSSLGRVAQGSFREEP